MIHTVVDDILTDLLTLNFVDKIGGVVYPLQLKVKTPEGFAIKTIPIYGNNPAVCNNDPYIELVPDDRYHSCVFFEATPEDTIDESTHQLQVTTTCTLTMIGWFNLNKIDKAVRSADGYLRTLAGMVAGTKDSAKYHAVIDPERFRFRDPSVFAAYTFDEAEKQYLIYPYDFGAVEFSVQITYDLCDTEPVIDPDCINS